jgi:hypothetical protein
VDDTIAGAPQDSIPVRVEVLAAGVDLPIDLDDEARFAAREIGDVATDDDLAAEGDAQAATFELAPETLLGGRGVVTQVMGLRTQLELTVSDVARARG